MANIFRELGLTFVPLFVAMDSVGNLPILLALTKDLQTWERNRIVRLAILTALIVGLGFIAIGKVIFGFLGIEVADFLIAGGIILLVLSIKDLTTGKMVEFQILPTVETIGVVPLGTPLLVGPAVLTTLLILIEWYSVIIVVGAFVLNLAIAWILFKQANRVIKFLGNSGTMAISKIVSLLLGAIAVRMIRQGVLEIVE